MYGSSVTLCRYSQFPNVIIQPAVTYYDPEALMRTLDCSISGRFRQPFVFVFQCASNELIFDSIKWFWFSFPVPRSSGASLSSNSMWSGTQNIQNLLCEPNVFSPSRHSDTSLEFSWLDVNWAPSWAFTQAIIALVILFISAWNFPPLATWPFLAFRCLI